ncbi:MAG TPA: sulfatase-like hydrolase/transferase, partial [Azospira sp.]|nr:sulfatase-like hydrolase/transferase [Azospira sp.]
HQGGEVLEDQEHRPQAEDGGQAHGAQAGGQGAAQGPRQPLGTDAALAASWQQRQKPALFVIVVGETARAGNWGLNGYGRQTTPELAQLDVINFREVDSCGTNTEVSVPCLFSAYGRRHYDESKIRGSESLLHVLDHAGLKVLWRDNQSGCKGACDGLPTESLASAGIPGLCDGERCLDEVLLHNLEQVLADDKGNRVVVMHQLGNHGPAYYKRYPDAFRRFTPTCDSSDLRQCSREQIVNAYDNALLYTDHVLARTIAFLKTQEKRYDTAMVYVSDHGESLGENNLFLHGIPYSIAPQEQTRVPMVMWFSPGYARDFKVNVPCLKARAQKLASHDNLFHSVLGLLDVQTSVYERDMDLAAECRS